MCRCLMGISLVSQHGPNPQSSKPDRSMSLPDPRETAASLMGVGGVGNLGLKRLKNQRDDLVVKYEGLAPDAPNAPYNRERDDLLDQIEELERLIEEQEPPDVRPPGVESIDLSDPAARKAALESRGEGHLKPVPEGAPPGFHAMIAGGGLDAWLEQNVGPASANEGGVGFDNFPSEQEEAVRENFRKQLVDRAGGEGAIDEAELDEMVDEWREGLSPAMAGEPGRLGRSNPEGPVPDYVSPEPMTDEERQTGKEWIEKIRTDNEEVLNPDSSMMSSIWNSVMSAVPDIDPKTATMVAFAVAAALAAGTGVGSPLAPVILGGGAALASQ